MLNFLRLTHTPTLMHTYINTHTYTNTPKHCKHPSLFIFWGYSCVLKNKEEKILLFNK